ncbi:MAG: hypothetical protein C0518_12345, partial [Opitutus sp.]|nr:hypothetical protein [Opitutus sp.]
MPSANPLRAVKNNSLRRGAFACAFSFAAVVAVRAYVLDRGPEGGAITLNPGSTTLAIRLGTTPTLSDGSNPSTAVLAAMDAWNAVLGRIHLLGNIQPPGGNQQEEDGVNEIVFSATVYGQAYNPGVLAVTMGRRAGSPRADGTYRRVQADIFFNTANNWDSYRAPRQQNPLDLRRTAMHELGHVIGLLHPSDAGQGVAAVMNNNAAEPALTADDIAGGQFLYGAAGSVTRPANNDFASAAALSGTQATGANTGATKQIGEPNHVTGNFGGASVWWRWTAPGNGSTTVTTAGSNFDTVLAAYTGAAVDSLTQLASNDDVQSGVARTSSVTFNATSGTTYFLAVDGWDAEAGNVTLNVTFTAAGGGTAPVISGTLPNQVVTTGHGVAFTAGGSNGTVQWQISTDGGTTWANLANNATYNGVTTRTLEISNATAALN